MNAYCTCKHLHPHPNDTIASQCDACDCDTFTKACWNCGGPIKYHKQSKNGSVNEDDWTHVLRSRGRIGRTKHCRMWGNSPLTKLMELEK